MLTAILVYLQKQPHNLTNGHLREYNITWTDNTGEAHTDLVKVNKGQGKSKVICTYVFVNKLLH
jgi:hypothetical protein